MTDIKKFPIPTTEQEDLEEALGAVWSRAEKGALKKSDVLAALTESVGPDAFENLVAKGFLRVSGETVALTSDGELLAKNVARRHRLSERLLSDVLNLEEEAMDHNACRLEHIISPEVTESICTLLGHPVECPHGQAIPPGDCCRRDEEVLEPIVSSLDKMKSGETGKVVYLRLLQHPELHKLLSLGLVPGTQVHLHQTSPAFVIQVGENQLALEESIARNIYVRRA